MTDRPRTPAQRFRDAVWQAGPDELTTTEAMILLAYADHCRDGGDTAWVAQSRLIQRCKLRSKSTPGRLLARLVEMGWLALEHPARWPTKQSPLYRLLPDGPRTAPSGGAVKKRRPPRPTGRSTAPSDGAVDEGNRPVRSTQPPRQVDPTAPSDGANRPVSAPPLSSEGLSEDPREGNPPRTAAPRDGPPEEQTPADAAGPSTNGRDAARAIALQVKRRDVVLSRWNTRPPADPNPAYDPAATAVHLAAQPTYQRNPVDIDTEGGDTP